MLSSREITGILEWDDGSLWVIFHCTEIGRSQAFIVDVPLIGDRNLIDNTVQLHLQWDFSSFKKRLCSYRLFQPNTPRLLPLKNFFLYGKFIKIHLESCSLDHFTMIEDSCFSFIRNFSNSARIGDFLYFKYQKV